MMIFQPIIYLNKFYVTLHWIGTPGRLFTVHDHVTYTNWSYQLNAAVSI